MKRYTREHLWLDIADEITVGITSYACQQLGDIVYIELPTPNSSCQQGDRVAVIESVKSASEILAPLSGTITAVNTALTADPEQLSADTWLFRLQPTTRHADIGMDLHTYQQQLPEA